MTTKGFTKIIDEKISSVLKEVEGLLKNDPQKAVTKLTRAIAIQPKNAELFKQRAEAYEILGDHHLAILNLSKAILLCHTNNEALVSKLASVYCSLGQTLYDNQQYDQALRMFKLALEYQPQSKEYALKRIICLSALKRYDECIVLIKEQLDTDGSDSSLYARRSLLNLMFGDNAQAFYDACKALELDPQNAEAERLKQELEIKAKHYKSQAISHALIGQQGEAIQSITNAIDSNPKDTDYHIFRGALYRKTGEYTRAMDDFLLVMDMCHHKMDCPAYLGASRQLVLTYNDFAIECFRKGHYSEAITLLNRAIKSEKCEKGLYINRGDCFYRTRDLLFALADYRQAYEIDRDDRSINIRISIVCCEIGIESYQKQDFLVAQNYFSDAIRFSPYISHFYLYRASVLETLKDISDAEQDLASALLLDPQNEDFYPLMARICPGKSKEEIVQSYKCRLSCNHHLGMMQQPSHAKSGPTSSPHEVQQPSHAKSGPTSPPVQQLSHTKSGATPTLDEALTDFERGLTMVEDVKLFEEGLNFLDEHEVVCSSVMEKVYCKVPVLSTSLQGDALNSTQDEMVLHLEMYYSRKAITDKVRMIIKTAPQLNPTLPKLLQ